jgi:hypothetical protein
VRDFEAIMCKEGIRGYYVKAGTLRFLPLTREKRDFAADV